MATMTKSIDAPATASAVAKSTDTEGDSSPLAENQKSERPEPRIEQDNGGLMGWVKNLIPSRAHDDESLRDAIEELIDGGEQNTQSTFAAHERKLLSNILALRDLPVVDVMVPRADIVAININTTREELFEFVAAKPLSRIPVYKDDLDNIVGVLHMKDLVIQMVKHEQLSVKDSMRDVLVVSPAMRVMDMLLQMRQSKVHIAFVVDEFGGIDGLVTINDLISAIVGEIEDEFDLDISPQFIERPDGTALVDARFPVEDFEEMYGNVFDEDEESEEADTLGGLVTYLAGHVPARGEIIRHDSNIEFEVLDADPRRILRLRIRNLPQKKQSLEN